MQGDELTRTCRFETARLRVAEWHGSPLPAGRTLADVVATLLTPATTRALPSSWHGEYDPARAAAWIRERDRESAVAIATERETGTPVGLIIMFETPGDDSTCRVDVRLGYLLAESAWGRGLGTEMVAGFVAWCRSTAHIRSIAGGVGLDNVASARTLAKNGFTPVGQTVDGERVYQLDLLID